MFSSRNPLAAFLLRGNDPEVVYSDLGGTKYLVKKVKNDMTFEESTVGFIDKES